MKIVLSAGQCEKHLGTTTKLLYAVSECMAQNGHKCYIIGASEFEDGHDVFDNGVEIIRFVNRPKVIEMRQEAISHYEKYAQIYKNTLVSKVVYAFCHPIKAALLRTRFSARIGYGAKAASMIREINPDAIICMQDPVLETKDLLAHIKWYKKPLIIYQVDPWGMWDQDKIIGEKRTVADELKAIARVDYMFTTKEMYRRHQIRSDYKKFIHKIAPVEFPNMYRKKISGDCVIPFDKEKINILYTGSLQRHRSPGKFMELLGKLIEEDDRICCHFVGSIDRSCMESYLEKYPNNYFLYPPISPEEAYCAMKEADFLLNVGNSYSNMVPSKIFDYFSMGKYIINTQKNQTCPAREYFDKYPRCLTVEEWHTEDYLQLLRQYLKNKGADLEYQEIEQIYIENTPNYVASEILKVLEG